MSLAAALAADGGRTSSMLPAIKCSNCAQEIEIAKMGEHLCIPVEEESSSQRGHVSNMSNPFALRPLAAVDAPPMPAPSSLHQEQHYEERNPYEPQSYPTRERDDHAHQEPAQSEPAYQPKTYQAEPAYQPRSYAPAESAYQPKSFEPEPAYQPKVYEPEPAYQPKAYQAPVLQKPQLQETTWQTPAPIVMNMPQPASRSQSPHGQSYAENPYAGFDRREPSPPASHFPPRQGSFSNQPPVPMPQAPMEEPLPVPRVRAPTLTAPGQPGAKPNRMALPRINSDVANRPFLAPQTPNGAPPSPAISVRSDVSSSGKRSRSRPRLYDPRPPSPELSANLDCAFPPFPTVPKERRPSTAASGRKTPTPSERAPSRNASRLDQVMTAEPDPVPVPPLSPTKSIAGNGGMGMLKRLGSLRHGPFRSGSRKGSGSDDERSRGRQPDASAMEWARPPTSHADHPPLPADSGFLSNSSYVPPPKKGTTPPPPEPPSGTEQFPAYNEAFSREDEPPLSGSRASLDFSFGQSSARAPTEQRPSLEKAPSEPVLRDMAGRPPMPPSSVSEPSEASQQIADLPPRKDSRSGNRIDYRMEDAPPVPKNVEQYRQDSRHSPSHSSSSASSTGDSAGHTNSSNMSPVGSAASSIEAFSPLSSEASSKFGDDERQQGLDAVMLQRPGPRPMDPPRAAVAAPRNFARPGPPRDLPPPKMDLGGMPMESPMDPAMQNTAAPGSGPWGSTEPPNPRPFPTRTHTAPGPPSAPLGPSPLSTRPTTPNSAGPMSPRSPIAGAFPPRSGSLPENRAKTPDPAVIAAAAAAMPPPAIPPSETTLQKAPSQRRGTMSRRGTIGKSACRGCHQIIEGKSVKAADGRLTGRWHKACFVCRSCREPFTTADFYVINNEPYCEHHYHEQNGSLCHGCNRGIEGPYAETTHAARAPSQGPSRRKYHPRCFTCRDCRMVLEDDYFEIQGNVFCERHAFAAMRAQERRGGGPGGYGGPNGYTGPGNSRLGPNNRPGLVAERRRTKLMMMNTAAR